MTQIISRSIELIHAGTPTSDGAGVKLTRIIDHAFHQRLDPFLLLDNFRSDNPDDYIAGFPPHPHRGIETITYMIAGRMRHQDSIGNQGLLDNGDVQWMTSGRGIIHSEMPEQDNGEMEGFQFWLNIPAKDKMNAPWYADFKHDELASYQTATGVAVTVIAGNSIDDDGNTHTGVVARDTEPMILDLHLPAGVAFAHGIHNEHNAFVVVYRGEVQIAGKTLPAHQMAVLANETDANGVVLTATKDSKVLVVSGKPLNEPIVAKGPMVMNSEQQIKQAFADYRNGDFV